MAWDERLRAVPELDRRSMVRAFWAVVQSVRAARDRPGAPSTPAGVDVDAARPSLTPEEQSHLEDAATLAHDLLKKDFAPLGLYTAEAIMNQFRLPGFRDPVDSQIHGQLTRPT